MLTLCMGISTISHAQNFGFDAAVGTDMGMGSVTVARQKSQQQPDDVISPEDGKDTDVSQQDGGASSLALIRNTPSRRDSGLTKAEYLLQRQNFAAALEETENVLIRHPDDADALTYAGYAYMNLGDPREAARLFRKALQADSTHLGANQYMGELMVMDGKVAGALDLLQVIRMVCGKTDCAEERALRAAIDKAKIRR